jgi:hypothetical protein
MILRAVHYVKNHLVGFVNISCVGGPWDLPVRTVFPDHRAHLLVLGKSRECDQQQNQTGKTAFHKLIRNKVVDKYIQKESK